MLFLGRVLNVNRDRCAVAVESGIWRCVVPGSPRRDEGPQSPAVGDWVEVDEQKVVRKIQPRRSVLSRKAAGRVSQEQIIAANVDIVFIVQGLDHDFNPRRLERYLAMVQQSGAAAVVILTKPDVALDLAGQVAETRSITDAPVLIINGLLGEGVRAVKDLLAENKTGVLVGSSGAGKSTLLNALLGDTVQKTRAVRADDSRGRHTTTTRQMFFLPDGGSIIDNPGMRELGLWAGTSSVEDIFPEIESIAGGCRFRDCSHENEPDCAVIAAVEGGRLPAERLESFRKLRRETERLHLRDDVSSLLKEKGKVKALHRAIRDVSRTKRRYRGG